MTRRSSAVLIASVLLAGAPALARPADADADAYTVALTRAIAAKERALDVNEPPRWEEALRLFQEAAALRYSRECAYEIGVAAEHLAREDLAVEGYEASLDLGLVGPPRVRAQGFVAAHASALARLALRGPAGTRVRVAGMDRGRLPLHRPLVLFPGDVRIEVIDPAGAPASVTVRLQAGHLDLLDLDKNPAGAAGSERASKPPPPAGAPPATAAPADLAARAPPAASPAAVPAAETSAVPMVPDLPALDGQPVASTRGFWVMGAGAAVTIAALVLLPVSSSHIDADRTALVKACADRPVDDTCPIALTGSRDTAQSLVDSIATWKAVRTGAKIGIGVGVAVVGAGLIMRLYDQSAVAAARPALVFDQDGGRLTLGLGWTVRF